MVSEYGADVSSSVTITSSGSPTWVEGTTPKVVAPPYQP